MITKFDSLFAGHADLDNVGYGGTPINDRRFSNAHLATALSKAEAMAKLMDGLGYNCFWMAEHHFQREGTECIPNDLMMAVHLAHRTKNLKIGCGFNITPMWHPLRLAEDYARGRHPHRRPRRVRRRPRLPHARGRDVRLAAARPGGQPRAVRGAGRHHLQGLQRGVLLAQGQALHAAARGALSRLHAEGADAGAAALQPAGRVLAADPGRLAARARVHGQARHPGHGRRRLGRGRRHAQGRASPGRRRTPGSASRSSSASGCASASTSTWPTAASRA